MYHQHNQTEKIHCGSETSVSKSTVSTAGISLVGFQ